MGDTNPMVAGMHMPMGYMNPYTAMGHPGINPAMTYPGSNPYSSSDSYRQQWLESLQNEQRLRNQIQSGEGGPVTAAQIAAAIQQVKETARKTSRVGGEQIGHIEDPITGASIPWRRFGRRWRLFYAGSWRGCCRRCGWKRTRRGGRLLAWRRCGR
jgi:hypothetical protein